MKIAKNSLTLYGLTSLAARPCRLRFKKVFTETCVVKYTGYSISEESIDYSLEIWYAPTQYGGITHLNYKTTSSAASYSISELIQTNPLSRQYNPLEKTQPLIEGN